MSKCLLLYLQTRRRLGQPETFNFGIYGKDIQYTSQPLLKGLVENAEFLTTVIPALRHTYRKSTVVRDTFLHVAASYEISKVNVSSYNDVVWARWCASSTILLVEHLQKLSTQSRILRQVLMQDGGGLLTGTLQGLIDLWVGGDGPVLVAVKREPDDNDHTNSPVTTAPSPSASSRARSWSPASSNGTLSLQLGRFQGGALLKACLTGDTSMLTDEVEEEEKEEEEDDFDTVFNPSLMLLDAGDVGNSLVNT